MRVAVIYDVVIIHVMNDWLECRKCVSSETFWFALDNRRNDQSNRDDLYLIASKNIFPRATLCTYFVPIAQWQLWSGWVQVVAMEREREYFRFAAAYHLIRVIGLMECCRRGGTATTYSEKFPKQQVWAYLSSYTFCVVFCQQIINHCDQISLMF